MTELTKLQRRILALLEEAGEDHLLRTYQHRPQARGMPEEILAMRDALDGLIRAGLVTMAVSRNNTTLRLIPLKRDKAISLLQEAINFIKWSEDHGLWEWNGTLPCPDVVVTRSGLAMARKVLSEDGWPATPHAVSARRRKGKSNFTG